MDAVSFVALHIITAGTEGENIGSAVFVGFEGFVGRLDKGEEVENVALSTGDLGDDVVTPND